MVCATRARWRRARAAAPARGGLACRAPAVRGKLRCRMHGGALGSGAPRGNRNARKHGAFTRDRITEQRAIQELLEDAGKLLGELDSN
ncbi:HGGxSTG domain-containing protein [Bradyrhizobium sp. RDT46]|uniref:HGGxSTG domain-containing protein n=1 Tax=Bradyrhizobium sp. RDT46 TaxID=3341829 RepID=UPI0035C663C7